MGIKELILKKEQKSELTYDEIKFAIDNYVAGKISKADMVNFLKAIYVNGMSEKETFMLTQVMANSGKILKFSDKGKVYADKHSTGGVSDSTTMIIAPIIACTDIRFLKMSGRKLGHTGGTADKLECFKGYKTDISLEEAKKLLSKNGAALITQTDDLAPADKYIYKLRDESDTVISIPLIASSVMSKKITAGNDIIVLDVKCGDGAFMKNTNDAVKLAKLMVSIGRNSGKKTCAVISDMSQPLGSCIGSCAETIEAIKVLKGEQGRLRDLSLYLAAKIIQLGKNIPFEQAKDTAVKILNSGKALKKFKKMIKSQGGSLDLFDDKITQKMLSNPIVLKSNKEGYLSKFDLEKLGNYVREYCSTGNIGIKVLVNLGDYISKGTPIIELYGNKSDLDFASCLHFSKNTKSANKLIIDVI